MTSAKRGAVGRGMNRVDGVKKTGGRATFTAEYPVENVAYGVLVAAGVPRGTIKRIDRTAAEAAPGVLAVLTHENVPKMKKTDAYEPGSSDPGADQSTIQHLVTDQVYYDGQPVAVVVADSLEQAQLAATLVRVEIESKPARLDFRAGFKNAELPDNVIGEKPEIKHGDAEAALAESRFRVDNVYTTPMFNHNAIEPHATLAAWSDDEKMLMVYDATQNITGVRNMFAKKFSLEKENVRVLSPFVGGGFGGKGGAWPHVALTAAAAKAVKRPVKIVLSREDVHRSIGGRTPSVQRVALGADERGKLTSLVQTGTTFTTEHNEFAEQFTFPARHLYASETAWLRQEVVHLDVVPNTFMRAPGESIGTFALESAMDELAHELGVDPIDLRMRNEPEVDPTTGNPFSMRSLREAYRVGADMFEWSKRNIAPRTTRDGNHLVGLGVATAFYPAYRFPASARVEVRADGSAIGYCAGHEMGMGTATAQAQGLADQLGLDVARVRFEIGDSSHPESPIAGGSNQTISIAAAVVAASDALKRRIHGLVGEDERSPLMGTRFEEVDFADGTIFRKDDPSAGESFATILKRFELDSLDAEGTSAPPVEMMQYGMFSYGAQFSEVRVDEVTGEVRVARFLGMFDCGRIVNPKTASSQWRGGITMGIGMALTEESLYDARLGRIVNPSLAEYHVPVNADVPKIDVHFLDIPDPQTPLGARGIGEIGITGVAASIANAVFNATGRRIRDLPITLDKLL